MVVTKAVALEPLAVMIPDRSHSVAGDAPSSGAGHRWWGGHPLTYSVTVLIAALLAAGLFAWQGRTGLNLADEGYLWYGVQRVLNGEVPLRDFMAYDPGRYYWFAAFLAILGDDGLVSLRVALSVVQAMGLATAMLMLVASVRKIGIPTLVVAGATMAIWMIPRHKLPDISISIILVGALFLLVARPSRPRWFFLGLVVGVAAVFGRNHGVYGAFASLVLFAWLSLPGEHHHSPTQTLRAFALWSIGVAVGFSPIVLMALVVPGFADAFWDSIRFLFEIGNTNLPLPVPWPWLIPVEKLLTADGPRAVVVSLFFVAALCSALVGVAWVYWARARGQSVPPAIVAALVLSLPYAHVIFSRADVGHLAQGIPPVLIATLVAILRLPATPRWPLLTMMAALSVISVAQEHPGWYCATKDKCVTARVANDELWVPSATAADVSALNELIEAYAPDSRLFLAMPSLPGAYALAGRRSPVWEIFGLFPRSAEFQRAEIERIEATRPGFVVIADLALDGREELRFRNTHSILNKYIEDTFELVSKSVGGSQLLFYRDKGLEK